MATWEWEPMDDEDGALPPRDISAWELAEAMERTRNVGLTAAGALERIRNTELELAHATADMERREKCARKFGPERERNPRIVAAFLELRADDDTRSTWDICKSLADQFYLSPHSIRRILKAHGVL